MSMPEVGENGVGGMLASERFLEQQEENALIARQSSEAIRPRKRR